MLPRASIIELFQYLRYLDQVGLPLETALMTIREDPPHRRLVPILDAILQDLLQGQLFSAALQRFHKIFSPVTIQLIQIGERTGKLTPYFEQIEAYLSWQARLTQQVHRALRYGLLMLAVSIAMALSLVVFLLPQVKGFLGHLGVEKLPLATRTLMAFSQFCESYGLEAFILLAVMIALLIYQRPAWMAYIPGIGRLWIQRDLTQYLKTLAALIQARVDLISALTQASQMVQLKFLRQKLEQLPFFIGQGNALSSALTSVPYIPPLIVRLVRLGESTGQLPELLSQAATWAEVDYSKRVERFVASLHPLLVFLLGLFIIWVVSAILLPLYQQVGSIASLMPPQKLMDFFNPRRATKTCSKRATRPQTSCHFFPSNRRFFVHKLRD